MSDDDRTAFASQHAIRMAARGDSPERLVATLGLKIGDARRIVGMYGKHLDAKPPPDGGKARPMTPREVEICKAFANVTFPPATSQKRFANNMAFAASRPDPTITEKQAQYVTMIAWRYRRQMPADLAYPDDPEGTSP